MEHYLNQNEYMRWFRNYQMSQGNYLAHLAEFHQYLDNAEEDAITPEFKTKIEKNLNTIEAKIQEASPRDFSNAGEPLQGGELFLENMKILINVCYKMFHQPVPFKGIYETEKERVQKIHQTFKFKDKLMEIEKQVDHLLPKQADQTVAQPSKTERENILL